MSTDKLKLKDFDPATYLDTAEARAEYIRLAKAKGNSTEIQSALADVARAVAQHQKATPPNSN